MLTQFFCDCGPRATVAPNPIPLVPSPLVIAAKAGDYDEVMRRLAAGEDVNTRGPFPTPTRPASVVAVFGRPC